MNVNDTTAPVTLWSCFKCKTLHSTKNNVKDCYKDYDQECDHCNTEYSIRQFASGMLVITTGDKTEVFNPLTNKKTAR